jgi:hypothetical protein
MRFRDNVYLSKGIRRKNQEKKNPEEWLHGSVF